MKYWGGDQNIPNPRPSYQVNASAPGTDAAASAAASFAASYLLYSGTSSLANPSSWSSRALVNQAYADTLLPHAIVSILFRAMSFF
jgi:endoglucanase